MTHGAADARSHASEALIARKEELAREITVALYVAHPEWLERYGAVGRDKCLQDMRYTIEHLAPAVALGEPQLFAGYCRWLIDLLRPRGIPAQHVRDTLAVVRRVLGDRLTMEQAPVVVGIVDAGIAATAAAA